jgi:hypothetical protein
MLLVHMLYHSEHHKSPITYSAIALVILSCLFSVVRGFPPIICGLVAVIIVLCTCCLRVPKAALYTAAGAAVISSIVNFVFVARLNICANGDTTDCLHKAGQFFLVIGGILWIVSAVLLVKIPQRDVTPDQATFNQNQVAGHETA